MARVYAIIVWGYLDLDWSEWFDGLTITYIDPGKTQLAGPIIDQVALYSILNKVHDLGLELVSLMREEDGTANKASSPD